MATDSYKVTVEELLKNYKELRKTMDNVDDIGRINYTFKDYVEGYIKFQDADLGDYDLDEDLEDETEEDVIDNDYQ